MMTWINRMIAGLLAVAGFAGLVATALGVGAFFGELRQEARSQPRVEAPARRLALRDGAARTLRDSAARQLRESTIRDAGQASGDVNSDDVGKAVARGAAT